jgi:hypothetical protein
MGRSSFIAAVIVILAPTVAAQAPAALPIHKHESGLRLRVPPNWTVQDDEQGMILLPPGVTYDPGREQNPEVYFAATDPGFKASEERKFVEEVSRGFVGSGAVMLRSGERQAFTAGPRSGAAYTWEMRDPKSASNLVLRIFVASEGERAFVLVALGDADRVRTREAALRQILAGMSFVAPPPPLNDGRPR